MQMFLDLLWFLFSLHNNALDSTVLYVQYCMYSTVLYVQHFTIPYFIILLWFMLSGLLSYIKCLYSQNKKRYWKLAALFCFSNYFDVTELLLSLMYNIRHSSLFYRETWNHTLSIQITYSIFHRTDYTINC